MKKLTALLVGVLLVGLAYGLAQEKTQDESQTKAQVKTQARTQLEAKNQVQTKASYRYRYDTRFIDENGDGINDLAKDADADGIPNCQDPDWTRPLDGTGYKAQSRKGPVNNAGTAAAGSSYQLARDDDGDGIPNGQDPDWTRPLDGSGYMGQHRNGLPDETEMTQGRKAGKLVKSSFGKGAFRQGLTAAGRMTGTGVCDGAGPMGGVQRKGRR